MIFPISFTTYAVPLCYLTDVGKRLSMIRATLSATHVLSIIREVARPLATVPGISAAGRDQFQKRAALDVCKTTSRKAVQIELHRIPKQASPTPPEHGKDTVEFS